MAKTSWVIMKSTPGSVRITIHMIGFRSKHEAQNECNRLNENASFPAPFPYGDYYICEAKVFQPWEP